MVSRIILIIYKTGIDVKTGNLTVWKGISMKLGKVSDTILDRSIFKLIKKRGILQKEKPAVGKSCSVLDCSEYSKVITHTAYGKWATYKAANAIAAMGGEIKGIHSSIVMPEKAREIRLKEIIKELENECITLGIPMLGGHTNVSANVGVPIVSVTGIGFDSKSADTGNGNEGKSDAGIGCEGSGHEEYEYKGSIKPGQDIILTKCIGISGIRHIIEARKQEVYERFSEDVVNKAIGKETDMLTVEDAKLALGTGKADFMYAVSEGGIFAALWNMAEAGNVGLDIDFKAIPVRQEIIEICELFNVNPYELQSLGCLLVTSENGCDIISTLNTYGIESSVIGKVTGKKQRILHTVDEDRYLDMPKVDEIYRFVSERT